MKIIHNAHNTHLLLCTVLLDFSYGLYRSEKSVTESHVKIVSHVHVMKAKLKIFYLPVEFDRLILYLSSNSSFESISFIGDNLSVTSSNNWHNFSPTLTGNS